MFGLGGVFVEVFEDVTFRVPPFDKDEANRMVREVKGFKLLEGARGQKPANVRGLVDVIMKVQKLALDHADVLDELDINPLLVGPEARASPSTPSPSPDEGSDRHRRCRSDGVRQGSPPVREAAGPRGHRRRARRRRHRAGRGRRTELVHARDHRRDRDRPQPRHGRHHLLLAGRATAAAPVARWWVTPRWPWPPVSARWRWRGGRASGAPPALGRGPACRTAYAAPCSGPGRGDCCGRSTRSPCSPGATCTSSARRGITSPTSRWPRASTPTAIPAP